MAVPPGSLEGRAVLTAYFHDIVSRYHGREATNSEAAAAMDAEPSDDLAPPRGVLLVARQGSAILGCVGLRFLPAGSGEVTRVFVLPQARRRGVGGLPCAPWKTRPCPVPESRQIAHLGDASADAGHAA